MTIPQVLSHLSNGASQLKSKIPKIFLPLLRGAKGNFARPELDRFRAFEKFLFMCATVFQMDCLLALPHSFAKNLIDLNLFSLN